VPRIPTLDEGEARSGFFEADQFERLCAELPEDVQDVARFAYWTGCRKSEILGLQWRQVDFGDGVVRLEVTKSGEPRQIPLAATMRAILERRKAEHDAQWPWCPWVFCRDGKRIVNFYTSWKSACVRAKVDGAALLHDLRRTGVRNLVRAGVPEKVAMLISGHKTRSVFDRYHIVQGDDLKDAMRKLEKHLKGEK
jgi:integrase